MHYANATNTKELNYEAGIMDDLISIVKKMVWTCTGCGTSETDPNIRWGYSGIWCDRCWTTPPPDHAHEWYKVSEVIRLLEG